jgi:hypothetical protein
MLGTYKKLVVSENGDQKIIDFNDQDADIQNVLERPALPNWSGFMEAMRPYFPIGLAANYSVFTQLFNMLLLLRDRNLEADEKHVEWQNFVFNFGLGKSAFTPEQMAEIEAAMIAANIPVIK